MAFERYLNKSGKSGVFSYEIRPNQIIVNFINGSGYLYNNIKPGSFNIKKMQKLAKDGLGLNTFIVTEIKQRYFKKLR